MNKRGQAAMEFLMTYGWAIVVVLAAIGALAYFGVLSPQKLLPDRTTFTAPLPNVDNAVVTYSATAPTVQIAFKNNKGVAITLPLTGTGTGNCNGALNMNNPGSTYTNSTGGQQQITAGVTQIQNGGSFLLTFTCPANPGAQVGSKFSADFTFPYVNYETSQTLSQTGSVDGKYS